MRAPLLVSGSLNVFMVDIMAVKRISSQSIDKLDDYDLKCSASELLGNVIPQIRQITTVPDLARMASTDSWL